MLEYAKVFGNYYGTPKAPIELGLMEGKDFVFDVDWQGGDQIRSSDFSENVVSIFILPPSISELENRLLGRRQDSKKIVANRMAEAKSEIEHWKEYDYVLVNNEFHKTLDEIRAIVKASRLALFRNSSLESFVSGLNYEFEERKNKV